jgi:hypothetical protein
MPLKKSPYQKTANDMDSVIVLEIFSSPITRKESRISGKLSRKEA